MDEASVRRILDANHNRVAEGLRVVEEFVRFQMQDPYLTGQIKQLRHDLQHVFQGFGSLAEIIARDARGDVGRHTKTNDEFLRQDAADLLAANWQRVQQGLRVIEEYSKFLSADQAVACEQLRYRAYTLAKATQITHDAQSRLAAARLYVLIPACDSLTQFERLVGELVAAETDVLQLRDKSASDRDLLERARSLRRLTRGTKTLFIMNDRADLAYLADADGVHVGQDELTVAEVRRIVGIHSLVGVSTHSLEQAQAAVLAGANYIGCGPTFPSRTKSFEQFAGLDFLRQVADSISLPAFAIGGITPENVAQVLAARFSRIAVTAAVTQAAVPGEAARRLKELLRGSAD